MSQTVQAAPDESRQTVVRPGWKTPIVLVVFALVAFVFFGLLGDSGRTSTFRVSTSADAWQIEPLALSSRPVALALSALCLAIAVYAIALVRRGQQVPLSLTVMFGVAFVLAFLVWAVAGEQISLTSLLQGALALSVPLVFGAMSGLLCERSGVINIAIEGQLLAGAFLSAVVASLTGSVVAGLVAAVVAGLLVAFVLATFAIKYIVNQIIVGVVLNVLVLGVTNFFYSQLLAPESATWNSPDTLSRVRIPLLSEIPVLGPVMFNQTVIVYIMYITVIGIQVSLFRSRWGLRVRSVGEHPEAADTLGIDVNRTRFRNVLLGGMVAGFGGAFFTLGNVGSFSQDMSAGQGFIALAAMIFGRWNPIGALGAALLFGFANNLQSVLGIIGTPIPGEFMLMLPYVLTIFAVAGLVGRVRAPAADGRPYVKS
ncbi:nucleoside ABC transporter membrane protein [Haloactinopolyspora alba]|uniref:Nucleoside ABC transporter membrane protein n=1 Tax=Haloactinopolyspora alba TaxID=648780 RepID=A0A2P8E176_9ACTN|nr:ABC transporter permease [Haloactinopolyspora alba]PSL03220.1 nucleoside ABC transporter membrane protein [Haloactinopolyspora alba]